MRGGGNASGRKAGPLLTSRTRETPTLEELADDVERLKRRQRCVAVVVIVLTALSLLGLFIWSTISTVNNNHQDGRLNALDLNVSSLLSNTMQFFIELNGNTTVLQRGNVSWALAQSLDLTPPSQNCLLPATYIHQSADALQSTYELQEVRIGMLNFTVLVLYPPPTPLVYTIDDISGGLFVRLCLIQFAPFPDIINLLGAFGGLNSVQSHVSIEFTHSNAVRIAATPNCLPDGTCSIIPYLYEAYTGVSAFSVTPTLPFANVDHFFIQWFYQYNTGVATLGNTYGISEPLRLLLPSA